MNESAVMHRRAIVALGAASLAAPVFVRRAGAESLTKVSYQTGWLAQPEHGGYYQALATGLYRDAGLDVDIRKGGPQLNTDTIFLSGGVDFCEFDGFANSNFINESLPGVAVAAFFQKDPRVLLSHPGVGNDSLAKLKGKPILIATAGRQTYWLWLKTKFGFSDEQIRPYTFNLAPFLADKQVSMQGYITSEPYAARQAGSSRSCTCSPTPASTTTRACCWRRRRWSRSSRRSCSASSTPRSRAGRAISRRPGAGQCAHQKANPDMSDDKIAYAIDAIKKYGIVETAETRSLGIGTMSDERWKRFYDSMVAAGAQPAGLDVKRGYTLQFVNRKRV